MPQHAVLCEIAPLGFHRKKQNAQFSHSVMVINNISKGRNMTYNINPDGTIEVIHSKPALKIIEEKSVIGKKSNQAKKKKNKSVQIPKKAVGIESKKKELLICPYCKTTLKSTKYNKHINEKCPKLRNQKNMQSHNSKPSSEYTSASSEISSSSRNLVKKNCAENKNNQPYRRHAYISDKLKIIGSLEEILGYGDSHYANHGDYRYRENGRFGSTSLYDDYDS